MKDKMKLKDIVQTNLYFFRHLYNFSRSNLVAQACVSLIDGLSPLLVILIPKLIIDEIMQGNQFKTILFYIAVYAAAQILFTCVRNVLNNKYINMNQHLYAMHFLLLIHKKIVSLDLAQHDSPEVHQKMALAQDIIYKGIGVHLINGLFGFFSSCVLLLSTSAILFSVNPILIPVILCFSFFSIYLNLRSENWKIEQRDENMYLTRVLNYYIRIMGEKGCIKEMKMFSFVDWLMDKYYHTLKDLKKRLKSLYRYAMKLSIVSSVAELLKSNGIYVYFAWEAFAGRISIGEFTQYFGAANQFSSAMLSMVTFITQIGINGKYLKSYKEFMELESTMGQKTKERIHARNVRPVQDVMKDGTCSIRLENVCFTYPNTEQSILEQINFTFEMGKTYVIVGENGAGKTTLIHLLCKLYEPVSGTIYLNDTPISLIDDSEYRGIFSVVFQDFEHFAFTAAENIALNRYSQGDKDVERAVARCMEKAGLSETLASMPDGVHTQLERIFAEDGVILSGGEKQKMALARAMFREAPVLLLDEPTSALDPVAEDETLTRFRALSENKLVVYISHRMTSAAAADEILFIKNKTIHEHGPHSALMAHGGDYARYYNRQAKYYDPQSRRGAAPGR